MDTRSVHRKVDRQNAGLPSSMCSSRLRRACICGQHALASGEWAERHQRRLALLFANSYSRTRNDKGDDRLTT
jgi:hypothetical protein